jgi:multiple sugar transport system ATP-binding protein
MNLVEGTIEGGAISFAGFRVPLGERTHLSGHEGRTVIVGIRPSDLEDADVWAASGATILDVEVDITEELGSEVNVLFTVDAPPVTTEEALAAASDEGADDILPLIAERAQFCARVDARTRAKPGERVRLAVDPTRFHFFEPETGLAISSDRTVPATA